MAYLGAIARKSGVEPRIYDASFDNEPYRGLYKELNSFQPDIVGFNLFSSDISNFIHISKDVRRMLPDSTIIAGGPHATTDYRSLLKECDNLDYVLIGETERDFPKLLQGLSKGGDLSEIQSLSMRINGKIKEASINLETDLDSIPFPAWDLYDRQTFFRPTYTPQLYQPSLPIIATRGCPFNCNFC